MKKQNILFCILFIVGIFLNSLPVFAGEATLFWEAPTTNADGTPLTDLAGYKIYYGNSPGDYSRSINVGNVTTYTVGTLSEGRIYYFAVTAHNTSGDESDYSNEVSIVKYTLSVNKSGTGSGSVTSSPSGINCGSDCSEPYKASTVITLTATPNTGFTFTGWSDSGCSGTGQCVVTINANTSVTATFNDTTLPTGSIRINNNAPYTKSRNVTLNLAATDQSGISQMCISDETSCTSWTAYSTKKSWTLTEGDGGKTVYAWFKDTTGNVSTPCSDSIILDTTAPTGSLSSTPGENQITLNWSGFSDATSGIASYKLVYSTSGMPASCSTRVLFTGSATSYTHAGLDARKTYYYRLCAADNAGNTGSATASEKPLDTTPPSCSITINNDALYTKSQRVILSLSSTDLSGVTHMCISNETSCTSWVAYARKKSWRLPAEDGEKTVYVWFKDGVGNVSPAYSDSIIFDTTKPSDGSPSATPGENQVILNWSGFSDATSGVASYKLVYSTSRIPSSCSMRGLFTGSATSYTHAALDARKTYYYRVCATDNAGNISTGSTASAKPFDTTTP